MHLRNNYVFNFRNWKYLFQVKKLSILDMILRHIY